jgi:hypothetical protein
MPDKNGKRDTQRTETGCGIPVPKRDEVMDLVDKAAKKRGDKGVSRSKPRDRKRKQA